MTIRPVRTFVATLAAATLLGCSPTEIAVSHSELGGEGHTLLNFAYAEDRRESYTTEDEKVVFAVRLGYNIVGYYTAFRVHWVAPTGATYLDAPALTAWGSNQALIAELPIKGTPAMRLPGLWQVRLYAKGELLAEHEFELLDARYLADQTAAEEAPAAGEAPKSSSSSYAGLGTLELPPEDTPAVSAPPQPPADTSIGSGSEVPWVDIRRRLESQAGIAEIDALGGAR